MRWAGPSRALISRPADVPNYCFVVSTFTIPSSDRMLFIHRAPSTYGYWMYQTLIPLDIIWMDASKQVVEIVSDAPPCKTEASKCPHFGGNERAQFVLELRGGMARKYGIKAGDSISF